MFGESKVELADCYSTKVNRNLTGDEQVVLSTDHALTINGLTHCPKKYLIINEMYAVTENMVDIVKPYRASVG